MLIHFGVTPYLVFDGDYLPSKAATEDSRAKRREESKRLGLELHKLGKTSQAHLELQKAVDVTPQMARQLIEELKLLDVEYIVAPYEADAQLAYLERKGIIDGILSEDSDLLVFGAQSLLTKLDQYGDCVEINRKDFTACREISLVGWTDEEFRRMAILSGCDYLASINKMGLKTAYRLVRKHKTIEKILRMLQFDGQYHVPNGYLDAFRQAELTFLHQRVFCPLTNSLVLNTDTDGNVKEEDMPFIGSVVEQDIAIGVARGDLCPMTKAELLFDRRHKANPITPRTIAAKKQTSSTLSDLKIKKPIDSFFKPRRTPLAELDPNSFTPSPSQQRLLQRPSGSWSSSAVPSGTSFVGSNNSPPASVLPTPRSQPTRSQPLRNLPPRQSIAPLYPSKRQRLCSDLPAEIHSVKTPTIECGRSPFFTSSLSGPSPSVRKGVHGKKPNRPEVNIWSDDSIEDVMAGLPDVSDFPQPIKKGKVAVFADNPADGNEPKRTACGIKQTPTMEKSSRLPAKIMKEIEVFRQTESKSSTESLSASSMSSRSAAKSLDIHVSTELRVLKEKFSYKPPAGHLTRDTPRERKESGRLIGHRPSLARAGGSDSRLEARPSPMQPKLERLVTMTPLQRFAASALQRPNASSVLNSTKNIIVPATLDRPRTSPGHVIHDVAPKVPFAQSTTLTNGSEDMIVPDSEYESEGEEAPEAVLNLGRFAFNATCT